jgi:hypothetical protein
MTNETISNLKVDDAKLMELGITLGQNQTFGLIAGRCSAAQAHIIRRLREEKLYKRCCDKWDDFCSRHLSMCRSEADRFIRLLDEFGPAYFEVSQFARISPTAFRAIAPAITDGVLHHNGEAIALIPENSQKVAAAVADMRSALPKKPAERSEPEPASAPITLRQIQEVARRCAGTLDELFKISRDKNLGPLRVFLQAEMTSLKQQILTVG